MGAYRYCSRCEHDMPVASLADAILGRQQCKKCERYEAKMDDHERRYIIETWEEDLRTALDRHTEHIRILGKQ